MKITALRFLFCAFVAIALSVNSWAQTNPGDIKPVRIVGQVQKLLPNAQFVQLTKKDILHENDTVVTGKDSSVVLVFMNGSSIQLGADTRLKIDEFKMEKLDQEILPSKLTKEPSVSKTALNLAYGEIVGDVKKLNTAGGSTYSIKTPVGAAGIRGTVFRIVFRPTSDGKAFTFQLSTSEGLVVLEGVTKGTGTPVDVPADKEIVVTGDINLVTGKVTFSPPTASQPIAPEAVKAINTAVKEVIQEAQKETVFVPAATPVTTEQPTTTEKTPVKNQTPTPPPAVEVPAPTLTPGAGK